MYSAIVGLNFNWGALALATTVYDDYSLLHQLLQFNAAMYARSSTCQLWEHLLQGHLGSCHWHQQSARAWRWCQRQMHCLVWRWALSPAPAESPDGGLCAPATSARVLRGCRFWDSMARYISYHWIGNLTFFSSTWRSHRLQLPQLNPRHSDSDALQQHAA